MYNAPLQSAACIWAHARARRRELSNFENEHVFSKSPYLTWAHTVPYQSYLWNKMKQMWGQKSQRQSCVHIKFKPPRNLWEIFWQTRTALNHVQTCVAQPQIEITFTWVPPDTSTKSMMIKNIMALLEFKQLVGSTTKNGLHVLPTISTWFTGPSSRNKRETHKQTKKTRHTTYHDHQCTSMMHQNHWCLEYALWKTLRSPHFFRLRPEQVSILLC